MQRSRALSLLLLVLLGGCLSGPGATATTDGGTPTPGTLVRAMNNPDADHGIHVENRWNRSVTLTLRIVHDETGDVVYEETWTEPPKGEHEVYNLNQANPVGVERFRVVLEVSAVRTATIQLETSGCYGDAFFTVTEHGDLEATYAIC